MLRLSSVHLGQAVVLLVSSHIYTVFVYFNAYCIFIAAPRHISDPLRRHRTCSLGTAYSNFKIARVAIRLYKLYK